MLPQEGASIVSDDDAQRRAQCVRFSRAHPAFRAVAQISATPAGLAGRIELDPTFGRLDDAGQFAFGVFRTADRTGTLRDVLRLVS